MVNYTPTVKAAQAFREISQDFADPAEIFREAIANSIDAYAKRIWLRTTVERIHGMDKVVIYLSDDGIGLSNKTIHALLNLSDSVKPQTPPVERVARSMTGYKGHGTKIYYNSELLEILSYDGQSSPIFCRVQSPRQELYAGNVPSASIDEISLESLKSSRSTWGFETLGLSSGTSIRVHGYHQNMKKGLEHARLRDYITWFTRWGSWEPKLREVKSSESAEVSDLRSCKLFLRGLGKESEPDVDQDIPFGHSFPSKDCVQLSDLRKIDPIDPLKFFVRTWGFSQVSLQDNPDKKIDFLFAIEGEGARRFYNDMLRRSGRARIPGDYRSEERYGLWLGRDYVPVQRFNSWVSEQSEYTRMHAFVNSNDLDLTSNRGSVENTPLELLKDIENTVTNIFSQEIETSSDYKKFLEELQAIDRHRHAKKEAEDYKRRVKRLESKRYIKIQGCELLSPATEMDLIALTASASALLPDFLPFAIRDYDSRFGFDGLAARNKVLSITETKHLFIEFKLHLKASFDHTFQNLDSIICWESRVKDGQDINDLGGTVGVYRVTSTALGQKKRFVVVEGSARNVEVIIVKERLEELGYIFKPIGE